MGDLLMNIERNFDENGICFSKMFTELINAQITVFVKEKYLKTDMKKEEK